MNKNDVSKAAATLTQAISFFAPMVTALNGADEVFSVLANATDHKDALTKEVAALQKTVEDLKGEIATSKAAVVTSSAEATQAKAESVQAIADAQQQANAKIADILTAVEAESTKAQAAFAAAQADIAAKIEANQKRHDSNAVQAQIREAELNASITQMEAKLEKVKAQAKKFADSFTVE